MQGPFGPNKTNLLTYLGGASQSQQPPIWVGAGTLGTTSVVEEIRSGMLQRAASIKIPVWWRRAVHPSSHRSLGLFVFLSFGGAERHADISPRGGAHRSHHHVEEKCNGRRRKRHTSLAPVLSHQAAPPRAQTNKVARADRTAHSWGSGPSLNSSPIAERSVLVIMREMPVE